MTSTSNFGKEALEHVQVTRDNAFVRITGIMRQTEVFGADQPTIPKIIWSATSNYRSLYYNGHEISISSISRLLLSLKDQANVIMRNGLLLGGNVPCLGDPIDEDNTEYVDKMSSERIGYSFLNDIENQVLDCCQAIRRYAIGVLNAHNTNEQQRKVSNYILYLFVCNGEVLTSPQLGNHLARETLKTLSVEFRLNAYRHIAIAFMSVHIQHFINANQIEDVVDYDVPVDLLRGRAVATDQGSSLLFHQQGSHTMQVANQVYAFSSNDFGYLSKDNILNYFLCSLEWQLLLGTEMGELEKQALRQQKPNPINLETTVRDIATIPRKKRILINGHSVNIGSNSYCGAVNDEDQEVNTEVTLDHVKALGSFYDSSHASFKFVEQAKAIAMMLVNILFVAVENCGSAGLRNYLNALNNEGGLSRMVFDQVHLTITASAWRFSMSYAYTVRQQKTPMVLLSATVPPSMERDLKTRYASNFFYYQSTHNMQKRNLYLQNRAECEVLQKKIATEYKDNVISTVYHAKLAPEEKIANQNAFMQETLLSRNMFATSAFAMGIDTNIKPIINYGDMPDSLLDYAQASDSGWRMQPSA
ncbi:hypothetical protein MAM1_0273d09060 [Mucor ambiguus]|uniref:Uncharacterized protein n=1 Tax=Mucor ambiguus TaxID=91626 RepID=A0A0C9LX24_9FUNG|nr:hypothetical protein MAM1_0273d09060 [Mucor ambiguus]